MGSWLTNCPFSLRSSQIYLTSFQIFVFFLFLTVWCSHSSGGMEGERERESRESKRIERGQTDRQIIGRPAQEVVTIVIWAELLPGPSQFAYQSLNYVRCSFPAHSGIWRSSWNHNFQNTYYSFSLEYSVASSLSSRVGGEGNFSKWQLRIQLAMYICILVLCPSRTKPYSVGNES